MIVESVRRQLTILGAKTLEPSPVLLTGASGSIGTHIRPLLRETFSTIRLSDRARLPVRAIRSHEFFLRCNLSSALATHHIMQGIERVVHLGARASDGTPKELAPANIDGVTNVLDAAVAHGVKRVVLASSLHVLGLYRRDEKVTCHSTPRPDSNYALTKQYAENLARLYHTRHGLSVVVLRIGHFIARAEDAEPRNWIKPDDLARLIVLALTAEDIGCEVWHAVNHADVDDPTHVDLKKRFGFTFAPDPTSRQGFDSALQRWYPKDTIARTYRGGVFASGRAMVKAR